MGTLADSLFTVLMGWVRGLVSAIWALFTSDNTTVLEFLGRNWLTIAAVIIGAGLVIDWVIWLLRWQPYHLWAQRARRLLRIEEPEEEDARKLRARPAVTKKRAVYEEYAEEYAEEDAEIADTEIGEEDARAVLDRAGSVPDRELRAYPGMLYDRENPHPAAAQYGTQRYSAISQQGPGAAEVERRREEIDEYRRLQEEAAQRARQEAAMRDRQAEQERIAREEAARLAAQQAEQERIAREAAAESEAEEAARRAQEQYERELAEYERQRAQYELELARYEQQKAAYDAQMAAQVASKTAAQETTVVPSAGTARRRRAKSAAYSEYVPGEDVSELPDPPAWPQMDTARMPALEETEAMQEEGGKNGGIFERVAGMLGSQEEEEIAGIRSLPPRVDLHDAYKPAKKPQKNGQHRR